MDNWSYIEELRSRLDRSGRSGGRGRPGSADRDVARMLSPWRRGWRRGEDPDATHGRG